EFWAAASRGRRRATKIKVRHIFPRISLVGEAAHYGIVWRNCNRFREFARSRLSNGALHFRSIAGHRHSGCHFPSVGETNVIEEAEAVIGGNFADRTTSS